ncbi:hypothetical protein [Enterococcus silesiacus]|nr:hypothetical protein [Enterococcus silesiacus]
MVIDYKEDSDNYLNLTHHVKNYSIIIKKYTSEIIAEINCKIEVNNELWKTAAREAKLPKAILDPANKNLTNTENKIA